MRCDRHDPKKRQGEPGWRCGALADWEVVRIVDEHRFVNYRCVWHVPETEPRIGTLEKRELLKQDHQILDTRSDSAMVDVRSDAVGGLGYHAKHVGDPI